MYSFWAYCAYSSQFVANEDWKETMAAGFKTP